MSSWARMMTSPERMMTSPERMMTSPERMMTSPEGGAVPVATSPIHDASTCLYTESLNTSLQV